MNQITRCPACATMFRVVGGQLKVAQGWVRCGQCGEVFDASLRLLPDDAAGLHGLPSAPEADHAPPDSLGRQDPVFAANAYDARLPESEPPEVPEKKPEVAPSAAQAAESAEADEARPEPAFVSQARRREFWQSPVVRSLLGLICLALLAALALQWVVQQKDVLAAQEPRLAPLLQALCRPLGCQIRPLRRVESLVLENTSFSKIGPDTYRLSFVFRNTGNAALAIPALQVTLTDSQDQALVRRVVLPAQFGATTATLPAYAELPGILSLRVGSAQGPSSPAQAGFLPVAGYRILAFYP